MAKISFDTDACKGCGLCVQACPRKLIQLSTHINKKGYNAAYCTCLLYTSLAQNAVEAAHLLRRKRRSISSSAQSRP